MKVFWAIVGVLVVGAAVYVFAGTRTPPRPARDSRDANVASAVNPDPASVARDASPLPERNPEASIPQPAPSPSVPAAAPADTRVEPPAIPQSTPVHGESAPAPGPTPAPVAPAGDPAPTTIQQGSGLFDVIPSTREVKDDGSVLWDGKWIVKGEGTKEKPYEVSWEMLTAVEHTYDPRSGTKKVAQAVASLDGAWVRIIGYVAFPMLEREPRELLMMLNQWDGCCIGVPPTPYDAIEVHLTETVKGDDRYAMYGTVQGRFGVKPYVSGDWLIGLYVMDEGTLKAGEYGGFGGS